MILTNLPSYIRFKSKLELINTVKKENTSNSKMNYPYRKTNHKGMRNKRNDIFFHRFDRRNNFNSMILATRDISKNWFSPISSRCYLKLLICLVNADYQLGALFIPNNRYESYFLLFSPCRGNLLLFVVSLFVFSSRNRPGPIAIRASRTCFLSVI